MDLAVGTHDEIIVGPLTDTEAHLQRLTVYGHLSDNQPIQVRGKSGTAHQTEKRFTVEEDF